jgi:carbamoyltransferase
LVPSGGNILGLSGFYHDSAACVLTDGRIAAAAQEERFSRKKFDPGFPTRAVQYCLSQAGLSIEDIDLVVFYENPAVKFNRIVETFACNPGADQQHAEAVIRLWATQKFWQKELIRSRLGFDGQVLFPLHHQSHAASAFFPSPYQSAAIVTIDGAGEWMTTTVGRGEGNQLTLLKCLDFPHSLGMFYSAFTQFLGFRINDGEYKLMGLAPYGTPKYVQCIRDRLIDVKDDGSFRLNMEYFDYPAGTKMVTAKFAGLFGRPARLAEGPLTQDDMDLARSAQQVTEEIMLNIARFARQLTGERWLCLAGGVALNCVANSRILRDSGFEGIWIQPASGDAGGALGAALFGWHAFLDAARSGDDRRDGQQGSLLGPGFADDAIEADLKSQGAVFHRFAEDDVVEAMVDRLAQGRIVGHFHGRMEFGPRALGNRSILADPRPAAMQSTLNREIKFRESFRPFAPAVLEDAARDYFDIPVPSPYMTLVAPVTPSMRLDLSEDDCAKQGLERLDVVRSTIPAVTHVDYSARVQTVSRETNPRFHRVLTAFRRRTGCPVLVNTSFNVRDEPIVCTPREAYRCFMATGMDSLVIGQCLLDKSEQGAS